MTDERTIFLENWLRKSQSTLRDVAGLVQHGRSEAASKMIEEYWKDWRKTLTGEERQKYDFIHHGVTPL